MKWKDKKVLVTGAGGFIGSHLVDELVKQGADVTAFIHYNSRNDYGMLQYCKTEEHLTIKMGDVIDVSTLRKIIEGKEIVFHLAALIGIPYSYIAPESYVNTNIKGTLNVMQACLEAGVDKVIHTSTSEVYGTAQYIPIDEKHPLRGQSPYSASKIGADKIAESFFYAFDLPVGILRPFNTYGPRQSARAIIPTIIMQSLFFNNIKLGLLSPVRDLTYVADTVKAFIKIAEKQKAIGMTINFGQGKGISIQELAEMIIQKVNPEAKIVGDAGRIRPEKSEVRTLICDNSLAGKILGIKPKFTLEKGLDNTINWIEEHIDQYKANVYTV